MAQGFQQVLRQGQSQVLAPQLRQSLKILQAAALDLRTEIIEELQNNPALEELPSEGPTLEMTPPGEPEGDSTTAPESDEMKLGEDFSNLLKLDEEWRDHFAMEAGQRESFSSDEAERRQRLFDNLTSETSLQEHLLQQAELTEASPELRSALEYVIGSLDDRGFLTTTAQDLALLCGQPLKVVQEAIKILRSLEPTGIGSASLEECLLAQLQAIGKGKGLAAKIIRHHFDLLLRRRIPEIARKLDVDPEDIEVALTEIAALDPAPGRRFGEDQNRVIVPDVRVEKQGDEWVVVLNNDYIPRLRLSQSYKDMIAKGKLSRKDKEYIQEKLRSGKFLINSIEQRQQTIERITKAILQFQNDFFENGVSQLRPLTMSQIAETVGVHETTVSRAMANKYVETPWGVFEFKYFFTPGYTSGSGESVSNTTIKDLIAKIVENENSAKPYSDQEIVEQLAEKGIQIARRTIAKYREELGILPTNLRRKYR